MNENSALDLVMARVGIGVLLLVLVGLGVACTIVGLRGLWGLMTGRLL